MTVVVSTTATAGSYTFAVTASGGTFSQTINLPLTLAIPPTFAVTLANCSVFHGSGHGGHGSYKHSGHRHIQQRN